LVIKGFFICLFLDKEDLDKNLCSFLRRAKDTNNKKDTPLQEYGFVVKTAVRIRWDLGNQMQLTDVRQIDWLVVRISLLERKNAHR